MKYETCMKLCFASVIAEHFDSDVTIYQRLPIPSDEEWNECLREVAEAGDDIQNPHHCMGRYELRLCQRGAWTFLDVLTGELISTANKTGRRPEFLADVLKLVLQERKTQSH